jgi:hypothetical protein
MSVSLRVNAQRRLRPLQATFRAFVGRNGRHTCTTTADSQGYCLMAQADAPASEPSTNRTPSPPDDGVLVDTGGVRYGGMAQRPWQGTPGGIRARSLESTVINSGYARARASLLCDVTPQGSGDRY